MATLKLYIYESKALPNRHHKVHIAVCHCNLQRALLQMLLLKSYLNLRTVRSLNTLRLAF